MVNWVNVVRRVWLRSWYSLSLMNRVLRRHCDSRHPTNTGTGTYRYWEEVLVTFFQVDWPFLSTEAILRVAVTSASARYQLSDIG